MIKIPFLKSYKRISYSQGGEDIIVSDILKSLKIGKPYYLDIGTYHPSILNNTYLLYLQGGRGVCVEPDPECFSRIAKRRNRDICLNVGIGTDRKQAKKFFVMKDKVLSTFLEKEAKKNSEAGDGIQKVLKIQLLSINEVIEKHCEQLPDFVSIDTEGLDFKILKTLNFKKYRPAVFCVETLTYSNNKKEKKLKEIITYMLKNGYFLYADTYINSIFVDKERWKSR